MKYDSGRHNFPIVHVEMQWTRRSNGSHLLTVCCTAFQVGALRKSFVLYPPMSYWPHPATAPKRAGHRWIRNNEARDGMAI